ncbi:DUF1189 family protein [Oceanobacillus iheyensis]|uniref:DUF1189 family protein n=1 Tax=Oceanobacillus iheyensis TaxID=182710 RepID=UPI0036338303
MIFLEILKHSIKLPQKQAMFQLNRIGMDMIILYLIIMLAIVSIPEWINRLNQPTGVGAEMHIIFQFIYFFMFYYLIMTVFVFIAISIIAYVGKGITHLMNRKLTYGLLWKMSACTVTIPFLLFTMISTIWQVNDSFLFYTFLFSLGLLFIMIQHYPKRRKS